MSAANFRYSLKPDPYSSHGQIAAWLQHYRRRHWPQRPCVVYDIGCAQGLLGQLLPLTGFQWLTADRTVQQTAFGDRVQLIANFGEREFQGDDLKVPARSLVARWRETGKRLVHTAWDGDGR